MLNLRGGSALRTTLRSTYPYPDWGPMHVTNQLWFQQDQPCRGSIADEFNEIGRSIP